MKKLKKIFSKRTFIITGITYIMIVCLIGYYLVSGGFISGGFRIGPGNIYLGPLGMGFMISVFATPYVLVASIVYIRIKNQYDSYVILGYLILTVGIAVLSFGYLVVRERLELAAHIRQHQGYIDFIENTLGPDIRRTYPNAEFDVEQSGRGLAVVRLIGFKYEDQPNFDDELSIWREIAQNDSFINFPMNIIVRYYIENTRASFATIRLNDFTFRYFQSGMSLEGLELLRITLKDYLINFHDKVHIPLPNRAELDVTIYGRLYTEDEAAEEEMWQAFISLHNINTELVRITVQYKLTENASNIRGYNVHEDSWWGSQ